MKEIIFITGNKGKQLSAQKYFDKDKTTIICCNLNIPEPYINNIETIAKFKVLQGYNKVRKPCIALDAGFYVPEFPNIPNFPGAFPKRDLIEKMGIDKFLQIMQYVENRTCYFKECLAYYDGYDFKLFYGFSEGRVVKEKSKKSKNEEWSSLWSIFIPKNCSKTLSEMNKEEEKNRPDGHTSAIKEFSYWYKNKNYIQKK